ncbi:ATP-dependent helicase [Brevundimonas sp. A19_0]|uniref:ATP-dependent helicase n=1 Tax=Brevundimonas sp. A19_0 TaxID=2821087 RepID=UPI001ADA819E|nr:ATP-dependent helicase [Brevundimonas sp. A19_0]MBO9501661.1 UvrD-helicase domain-containing protein [Brevundimonas sp. A19_0]
MDPFDPIRSDAAALHDVLVETGADPLDPFAFVQAGAKALDLELVWLAAGDPALKGARALYDDQSGTICCETAGDEVARALLVAHEIGHARLHAGSATCASSDIDATRSTEAAPVGLQRVEDYGARERRELQANVFAREFVLSRPLARRLHVIDGLGATDIATRTGLPLALVRQQLFDALLLPPFESADAAPASTHVPRPDPSQDRAAAHRGSPFQLQAGPGTGKTRTLVKRVTSLLADGIDPAATLILTFSNRAAGELSERLTMAMPDAAPRLWIGTFHAFGLDLLRRHHDRLGLSPDPALFDRSDAIALLEEILPTLPLVHYRNLWDPAMVLRDVVAAISRAKDEMADPTRYRALATAMREAAGDDEAAQTAASKCLEIADIYDLYEAAKTQHGGVDFGDLIMRPARLLEEDTALRMAVQLRHRHVLVDEYQDVNRASARLLKAVAGDGERLWVVGDSRQSIYRFRGASSANMARFGEDYPKAVVDQLGVNYRSTEQIVQTFVATAPRMGASAGMLPLALEADRGEGTSHPEVRRFETLDDEAAGVAAGIRELEAAGVPLRDQAVLCRSNNRLNDIAAALEARDIPVLHLGSLFEREDVRDLLALLSLAIDPFGDALVRVGAMPRYDLSLQDVSVVSRHLRAAGRPALTGLGDAAGATGLSPAGREAITRLAADLAGLTTNTSAWAFLSTYILDRTDLGRRLGAAMSVTQRMRAVAIWQFLNFVREQSPVGGGLPIQRTLDRVRQLVLLAEERDLRQVPAAALHLNAVRLMTVHGSKGLEFEAVHLPGLTVSSFPASNRGQRCPAPIGMIEGTEALSPADEAKRAHEHEEQCLFFVGLSRARTHLRLYLARRQPNGNNRSASPYLDWLPKGLVQEVARPAVSPPPGGALGPSSIRVTWPEDWTLTDSRLGAYEKCPRRFFYTHVLGLGGARKPTAFSRTHDCLYELLRWLADARRTSSPTLAEAEAAFAAIWTVRGPVDHAFAADYRRLATRLIAALVNAGAGRRFRESEPLAIDFANGRVLVEPNELAELSDGTVVVRRVRTGHKRSDEYDRLEYTLYQLAAEAQFGAGVVVQALHLTDEAAEPVAISPTKLSNRKTKSETMLAGIAAGDFPIETDVVTCPRCPHFFICAATPRGKLDLS